MKTVQMTEAEVRGLCLKSREIFLSQPILLELEAPLKICGKFILTNKIVLNMVIDLGRTLNVYIQVWTEFSITFDLKSFYI